MKRALDFSASNRARVVFPVPGAPQRINEGKFPAPSINLRQNPTLANEMALTHKFIERLGAHSFRQRSEERLPLSHWAPGLSRRKDLHWLTIHGMNLCSTCRVSQLRSG